MLIQREISTEQLSQLTDGGFVFAIVDACDHHEIVMKKAYHELGESRAICLFKGTNMESYDAVAPFLFRVDRGLIDWIANKLDKTSWGIFVLTKVSLEELCAHLQRFFMVLLPDGHKWFFSYYDPRVLKTYLPTCQPEELRQFFGPVRGFAVTHPEGKELLAFEYSAPAAQESAQPSAHLNGLWPVRLEQVDALDKLSEKHFVTEVAAHIREFFPEHYELLGEEKLYWTIHYGIQEAARYGITTEPEVCRYVDLLVTLGVEFEHDPRYGCVADILKDTSRSTTDRMTEIIETVMRLAETEDVSNASQ